MTTAKIFLSHSVLGGFVGMTIVIFPNHGNYIDDDNTRIFLLLTYPTRHDISILREIKNLILLLQDYVSLKII